jgi:hypothetical protein
MHRTGVMRFMVAYECVFYTRDQCRLGWHDETMVVFKEVRGHYIRYRLEDHAVIRKLKSAFKAKWPQGTCSKSVGLFFKECTVYQVVNNSADSPIRSSESSRKVNLRSIFKSLKEVLCSSSHAWLASLLLCIYITLRRI